MFQKQRYELELGVIEFLGQTRVLNLIRRLVGYLLGLLSLHQLDQGIQSLLLLTRAPGFGQNRVQASNAVHLQISGRVSFEIGILAQELFVFENELFETGVVVEERGIDS